MKASEKRQFISSLCNSIRDELKARASDMPEEWDGIELRHILADKFQREARFEMSRKRKRDMETERYNRNLP